MNGRITVRVVPDKCQGHARCHALAPELFELDELGNARATSRVLVPREFEDKAFTAQSNCPEGAIVIEDSAES
ncbi:ferredoxin [Bradyrhizobium sp. JYMT SZCCT0428]|uniref:ferredoxin n=1 Tax=Bradyrhizobium sp. JYMT SZCCT0428 TaxID=2807673 RepID=UPI001BA6A852|nr:ferredoxin [Bradyrhizobium sp. JYMT SZCCT0428]MBR1151442.1 ferredoxin [Bradyrhizobium sp. JYMT SZCCT0428]